MRQNTQYIPSTACEQQYMIRAGVNKFEGGRTKGV